MFIVALLHPSQRIALANSPCRSGQTVVEMAAPMCRRELVVGTRLFGFIEITDIAPAHATDRAQIYFGTKYPEPSSLSHGVQVVYEEDGTTASTTSIDEETGTPVIVKLTSSRELMERELSVRRDYQLSEKHVPKVYSVHHAEKEHYADSTEPEQESPAYCITMECAEDTLENIWLDLKAKGNGERIPLEDVEKIAKALLHLHERGLVHGDIGTHNIGKVRFASIVVFMHVCLWASY